ncbi:hypothetical protein TNCV_851961 [Trichonephila clavipes]|nr:hypothetical protein TNCV_851961 [Trichonephila clavipes]
MILFCSINNHAFPFAAREPRVPPKTFYFPLHFSTLKHPELVTNGDSVAQCEWPPAARRDTQSCFGANDFVDAFSPSPEEARASLVDTEHRVDQIRKSQNRNNYLNLELIPLELFNRYRSKKNKKLRHRTLLIFEL